MITRQVLREWERDCLLASVEMSSRFEQSQRVQSSSPTELPLRAFSAVLRRCQPSFTEAQAADLFVEWQLLVSQPPSSIGPQKGGGARAGDKTPESSRPIDGMLAFSHLVQRRGITAVDVARFTGAAEPLSAQLVALLEERCWLDAGSNPDSNAETGASAGLRLGQGSSAPAMVSHVVSHVVSAMVSHVLRTLVPHALASLTRDVEDCDDTRPSAVQRIL